MKLTIDNGRISLTINNLTVGINLRGGLHYPDGTQHISRTISQRLKDLQENRATFYKHPHLYLQKNQTAS